MDEDFSLSEGLRRSSGMRIGRGRISGKAENGLLEAFCLEPFRDLLLPSTPMDVKVPVAANGNFESLRLR